MSNPKKIEYLDPATNLQDDDLLFASVRDGGTTYVSKKVTLKDIADYVRSGMTVVPGSESGFGGYKIYDLSGPDYIENAVTMTAGTTNEANPWSHTFSQDCEVWVSLDTTTHQYIKIDGIPISTILLSWGIESEPNSFRKFYVKKNQTLTISVSCTVRIYPLKSGGNYFIDTNIPLEAPYKQYEQFGTTSSVYNFRFEATRKTLLVWWTGVAGATGGINSYSLNGKSIQYYVYRTESGLGTSSAVSETSVYDRLVLDTGDVVTFSTKATTNQHYSFGFYCAYPLMETTTP